MFLDETASQHWLEKLADQLGLPDDVTPDQVVTRAYEMHTAALRGRLADAMRMKPDESEDRIVAKAAALFSESQDSGRVLDRLASWPGLPSARLADVAAGVDVATARKVAFVDLLLALGGPVAESCRRFVEG